MTPQEFSEQMKKSIVLQLAKDLLDGGYVNIEHGWIQDGANLRFEVSVSEVTRIMVDVPTRACF